MIALVLGTAAIVLLGMKLLDARDAPAEPPVESAATTMPAVGTTAPPFELTDQDGNQVAIGPTGRWRIITFFRQANSPW